ncbi:unnamed protein product [Rhodiola kirilowii]
MDNNKNKFKLRISNIFSSSSCRDRSIISDTTKMIPNTNLKTKTTTTTHPFPSIHKPNSPMKIKPDPARQKLSDSYSLFYSAHSAPLLEKISIEKTRKKSSRRRRRRSKINNVRTELKHESHWLSSEEELDDDDDDDDDALLLGSGRRRRRDMEKIDRRRQHRHQMEQDDDDSYAVVKCSKDPYMDFRTSMVEMIVQKKMRRAEDLERLLQCFLKLNSHRHHPVIIEAFMDIWDALFLSSSA